MHDFGCLAGVDDELDALTGKRFSECLANRFGKNESAETKGHGVDAVEQNAARGGQLLP